jgi:uncharacterized YccA/Bax inhibitor family protein
VADLMRTSNPTLNDKVFKGLSGAVGETMTLEGTVNKTGILLVCAVATAAWTWHLAMNPATLPLDYLLLLVGLIGGLIFALITTFKKTWAPVTAPIYALLEGLLLGGISATFEQRYPGIAIESVCLTFGTMFVLLLAYRSGMIKVTQKFRLGVVAATGAIFLFYMMEMVLGFFGIHFVAVNGSGLLGIGISLVIVCVAAGAPKYMEWYGAFGLMVTLIWLYLEMLRLMAKLRGRR